MGEVEVLSHTGQESPGPQSRVRGTFQREWEADSLQAPRPPPRTDLQDLPNPSALFLPFLKDTSKLKKAPQKGFQRTVSGRSLVKFLM